MPASPSKGTHEAPRAREVARVDARARDDDARPCEPKFGGPEDRDVAGSIVSQRNPSRPTSCEARPHRDLGGYKALLHRHCDGFTRKRSPGAPAAHAHALPIRPPPRSTGRGKGDGRSAVRGGEGRRYFARATHESRPDLPYCKIP
jgi:hypothetical protein